MFHSKFEDCDLSQFINEDKDCIYLFGYGSLLWKVDFEYEKKLFGFVENFERQFWLLSDDHRGTPANMGRVLTLVNCPRKRAYGIAYRIHSTNLTETFEKLNLREKCGYSLKPVMFYKDDSKIDGLKCVCYFANQDNHYYSPQPDLSILGAQIFKSVGPSGTNKEYLYNACQALKQLENGSTEILKYDSHLFELEKIVRDLDT